MKDVVKRGNEYESDVHNIPYSEHPTKIKKIKRERELLEVVDENPMFIYQKIINITNVGLDHSIVDKILCNFGFHFKIPRKKSFW